MLMVVVLTSGLVRDGRSEETAEAELGVDDGRITAMPVPSRTRPTDDDRSAADAQVQPLARVTTVPDVATTHEQSGAHAQR
ncbi:hypothetical protein GCM10010464_71850 [Pseudonocardia yunnanensis]